MTALLTFLHATSALDLGLTGGVLLALLVVVGSMIAKVRADRREVTPPPVFTAATFGVLAPPSDSGFPAAPLEKRTPREARAAAVRARLATGACLYCDDAACAPLPTIKPVRPFLEPLLRYLNATPNARWAVRTERDADVPLAVCEKHHEQVVGLHEGAIADERVTSARAATEQRLSLYAFEAYGADESMQGAMQAVRAFRPATPRQADVLTLPRVNGKGAS